MILASCYAAIPKPVKPDLKTKMAAICGGEAQTRTKQNLIVAFYSKVNLPNRSQNHVNRDESSQCHLYDVSCAENTHSLAHLSNIVVGV